MFGDNLSVISDTTIAATKTQIVEMRDKFRINFVYSTTCCYSYNNSTFFLFARPECYTKLINS